MLVYSILIALSFCIRFFRFGIGADDCIVKFNILCECSIPPRSVNQKEVPPGLVPVEPPFLLGCGEINLRR